MTVVPFRHAGFSVPPVRPKLVMMGGAGLSRASYEILYPEIFQKFDVVFVPAPGVGGRGYLTAWEEHAPAKSMALRALACVPEDVPYHVWGHSMGCVPAALLARRNPHALSLTWVAHVPAEILSMEGVRCFWHAKSGKTSLTPAEVAGRNRMLSREACATLHEELERAVSSPFGVQNQASVAMSPLDCGAVDVPVRLVTGVHDKFLAGRDVHGVVTRVAQRFVGAPDVHVDVQRDTGHFPFCEGYRAQHVETARGQPFLEVVR